MNKQAVKLWTGLNRFRRGKGVTLLITLREGTKSIVGVKNLKLQSSQVRKMGEILLNVEFLFYCLYNTQIIV
jgi:hypothetical protein